MAGPRGCARHAHRGQLVLVAGTGGQGACAPTHPVRPSCIHRIQALFIACVESFPVLLLQGSDAAQYPCLGDGHARALWAAEFQWNDGRPFVLQLAHLAHAPPPLLKDRRYGQCHDAQRDAPPDWAVDQPSRAAEERREARDYRLGRHES
jgi:hypothetical protein